MRDEEGGQVSNKIVLLTIINNVQNRVLLHLNFDPLATLFVEVSLS